VSIAVYRDDKGANAAFVRNFINEVKQGRIVVLFAEGGRTFKGKEFKENKSKGRIIRRFENVAPMIRLAGKPIVVMAYAKGGKSAMANEFASYRGKKRWFPFPQFWNKMEIEFGIPFIYSRETNEDLENMHISF
ncbi:MAG: hypothetical protein PHP35_01740, partial [Candidatus Colwellbacteria bacterium]|nr:hypothetical protein [Candidatus Colwellbacteria bacterium]